MMALTASGAESSIPLPGTPQRAAGCSPTSINTTTSALGGKGEAGTREQCDT